MKRISSTSIASVLCLGLSLVVAGCDGSGGKPKIGVALFTVDDSFISAARRALESEAAGKARLSVLDGQNQQSIQNEQIDAMIAEKANAIIVNPVDSSTMGSLVFRAKAANVPIVFFSRNLSTVSINMWDKAYFVGVKAEDADALQVEILADYWQSRGDADKNNDGKMQYILVRGKASQSAALDSAGNRQKAFAAAGIEAAQIAEVNADWSRVETQKRVSTLLASLDNKQIEAVICANDEMALGAIEALKIAGLFKSDRDFVPVVGVDGARAALDAIADGTLLGTVRGDAASQGKAAFDLALALAKGSEVSDAGWALTEGKYVLVPYQKVTRANYKSFMN
jgi:methyl-galactoside transport system substrate-binding protein